MKQSKGKTATNKHYVRVQHNSLSKALGHVQNKASTKVGPLQEVIASMGRQRKAFKGVVARTGRFRCRRLPFVESLSRKNALAARVLEDSYTRGAAAVGNL